MLSSMRQRRLGQVLPLLLEVGKAGFDAYTTYQEGQNIKQQSTSDVGQINAIIAATNVNRAQSSQSGNKLPLYIAAGAAGLLVLITALS